MPTADHDMLDDALTLSPMVALRPEPFGALAYHFGNRKLTFLKQPDLVTLVRALGAHSDLRSALLATGIPERQWPRYTAALRVLAGSDMIRPRAAAGEQRVPV